MRRLEVASSAAAPGGDAVPGGTALGRALATTGLSLLLVACSGVDGVGSSQDASTSPSPAAAEASSTDLLRGRVLPLYAYQQSAEQSATVQRAHNILVNDCLTRFGFEPIVHPEPPPPLPPTYRRYGAIDAADAAEYGYHDNAIGQANLPGADLPPRPTWMSNGPLVRVLYGGSDAGPRPADEDATAEETHEGQVIPPGGCTGEANRTLDVAGVSVDDLRLAEELSGDAFGRAETDPRVAAGFKRWSSCMAEKGHRMRDPYDYGFDVEGPITDAERRAATDDVACKEETGLMDLWLDVEAEYGQELIEKNFEALTEARAAIEANVAKAVEVIESADSR